jgi:hypothetical protein
MRRQNVAALSSVKAAARLGRINNLRRTISRGDQNQNEVGALMILTQNIV